MYLYLLHFCYTLEVTVGPGRPGYHPLKKKLVCDGEEINARRVTYSKII